MASYSFERSIPGQSLTVEPRNAPYERPPEVTDPEEALLIHLQNLNSVEAIEDLMFFLELGVDIKTLTEGILRSAVLEGIHSVDISLIVAPTIHEYIKNTADTLDVPYDEGFDDLDPDEVTYNRRVLLATKQLQKFKEELDGTIEDVDMEDVEARVEEARAGGTPEMMEQEDEMMGAPEEDAQMEMDLEMPDASVGNGLMSRGM